MAAWNREQAGTQRLLKNDFSEARWKTAALKNAYALLGKRRFGKGTHSPRNAQHADLCSEYAAAWFLLAGSLRDAVNVCANQLEDLQLAIAVARVYEGDDSPVLRSLLNDKVLVQAAVDGNRWLATWAFWMLGQRDMAVRALIVSSQDGLIALNATADTVAQEPFDTLIELSQPVAKEAKSFLRNDPALVVLYKQLREKTLQTLKGTAHISPRAEWEFILQTARQWDRMGCDILALDLVRNWEFLPHSKTAVTTTTEAETAPDLLRMTRRRSSLVQNDMPQSPTEKGVAPKGKPPPTMFEEPEASSLLDSFGF